MKTVSILGCGWLGLPLAKKLKKSYHLKVTTTTENKLKKLQSLGFETFLISEKKCENLKTFLECDYLIIALPPSKFDNYLAFIQLILKYNRAKQIIFISSTSVYDKENGIYHEESIIQNPVNRALYETEQLFDLQKSVIFRCAGLMGYDRVPGKYFVNKSVVDKDSLVNYVHQDDVIRAIEFVLNKALNGIYNLCSQEHLSKEEIYTYNALKHGFCLPVFENSFKKERIIDGSKIASLDFNYQYRKLKDYI